MGLVNIQYWWKSSTRQGRLAGDDAIRRHPNNSSPDDRLATSHNTGRQQIPSEEVVPNTFGRWSHRERVSAFDCPVR